MGLNPINIHRDINWVADVASSQYEDNRNQDENDTRPIDFLYKLGIEGSFFPPLTNILSYLTPKDLSSAACVNRSWNRLIHQLPKPRTRLQCYLKELRLLRKSVGEENWPIKEPENTIKRTARKALARCAPQEQVEQIVPRSRNALKFTPAVKGKPSDRGANSTHKTPMNRIVHDSKSTPLPGSVKSKRNLKRL